MFPIQIGNNADNAGKSKAKAKKKAIDEVAGLSTAAFLISILQQGFSRLYRDGEVIELHKPEDYHFDDFDEHERIDRPSESRAPTLGSGW